jgi:hypothetical protein
MAYFTLLSGACGHTHGTMYWNASDSNILAWASLPGRVSLAYLSTFWRSIDGGRALIPRSDLITDQASSYDEKMLVASTQSGSKYVAYLPVGGAITIDLRSVGGQLAVSWFDPLSGHTVGNTTTSGGAVRSFPSPLGSQPSVLVLSGNTDSQVMVDTGASLQGNCCSTLLPGAPMATGFGTPWNVFNISELLLKAYSNGLQTTIALGPSTYVYSQGYAWVHNQWQQVTFTCTGGQIVQNTWCPTSAQATLPQNATFVVAYTCNWTGTQWNCGCADTTCRQNFWQLQKID